MGPPPCTSLLPRCLSSLAAPVLITHSSLITRSFRHPEASVLVPLVDPLSGAAWPRDVPIGERGCPLALSVPFCIHGGSRCPHGSFTTAVFFLPAPSAPIYRGFAACEAARSQTGGLLGSLLHAGMLRPQHKPASCPRAPATAHGAGGDLAAPSPRLRQQQPAVVVGIPVLAAVRDPRQLGHGTAVFPRSTQGVIAQMGTWGNSHPSPGMVMSQEASKTNGSLRSSAALQDFSSHQPLHQQRQYLALTLPSAGRRSCQAAGAGAKTNHVLNQRLPSNDLSSAPGAGRMGSTVLSATPWGRPVGVTPGMLSSALGWSSSCALWHHVDMGRSSSAALGWAERWLCMSSPDGYRWHCSHLQFFS